jgi:multidrug efflux pump subunit AcrA (membrane-fusion protein)
MKKKLIGAAVIVAFFAVPVAVKLAGKPRREAELATVQKLAIHPSILATGNLVFRQEVQLSAEVIGKVAAVQVKEGDQVARGQILLKLDPTVYLAEVAQQEASRRNAAIAIERAQINLANQQRSLERTGPAVQGEVHRHLEVRRRGAPGGPGQGGAARQPRDARAGQRAAVAGARAPRQDRGARADRRHRDRGADQDRRDRRRQRDRHRRDRR